MKFTQTNKKRTHTQTSPMEEYFNQLSAKNQSSFNSLAQFLIVLFVAKFLKSVGIYLCYDLLKHIHLVQLLFFALLIAALVFLVLQKPFSAISNANKRLSKFIYFRIFKYSFVQTLIKLLWLLGLTQCGPLRTSLLFEQSEVVVLCALKVVFLSQTNPSRTRGVVILLLATLLLLAFDYDDIKNLVIAFSDKIKTILIHKENIIYRSAENRLLRFLHNFF